MPPNRSRRLPGGKVRRPAASGPGRPARAVSPASPALDADVEDVEVEDPVEVPVEEIVSLEEYRVARPEPAPAPAVTSASASRRLRDRAGRPRVAAQRTGPSSMDVVARTYAHIRGDLIRIAIIALVMFGIIIALSFVIR